MQSKNKRSPKKILSIMAIVAGSLIGLAVIAVVAVLLIIFFLFHSLNNSNKKDNELYLQQCQSLHVPAQYPVQNSCHTEQTDPVDDNPKAVATFKASGSYSDMFDAAKKIIADNGYTDIRDKSADEIQPEIAAQVSPTTDVTFTVEPQPDLARDKHGGLPTSLKAVFAISQAELDKDSASLNN